MKGSRLLFALIACLLPCPLFAQQAAPAQAPAAAAPSEAKPKKPEDPVLAAMSRAFYATMLHRDVDALLLLCRAPFYFEGQLANTTEEMRDRWSAALQNESFEGATLYGVELYTPEELTEKYGKPPEKLAAWPLKGSMISVGNIDGHPLLVLWKKAGTAWQAVAFHD